MGHTKIKGRTATAALATAPDGSMTVTLTGELDHEGVIAVEGEVHRAAATAVGAVILDAEKVTFVDSAGLRLVLQTQMTASSRDLTFVLARPSDNVVRLLELTGLDDLIATTA